MWIWQQKHWSDFSYDANEILPVLEKVVRTVSPLVVLAAELDQTQQLRLESQVLLEETLASAKIEGEMLNRESVRSSIANHLGIAKVNHKQGSKSADAFVDILLEAVRYATNPLTQRQLFQWHQRLFIEKPILYDMTIGDYRNDKMQVVSGRYGKQTIHYEAPCQQRDCVAKKMQLFLAWLNRQTTASFYIKAAIAKFWFVTIHPFDDGNGRLSRMIAERCLARSENTPLRLYSISQQLEQHKNDYYEQLESCQKGKTEITQWIIWFLQQVTLAAQFSRKKLQKIRLSILFWDKHRDIVFNPRQIKLIKRLLQTDDFATGIARKKYKRLAHTTDITASRDLKDLCHKKVLIAIGAGRAVKYQLNNFKNS